MIKKKGGMSYVMAGEINDNKKEMEKETKKGT